MQAMLNTQAEHERRIRRRSHTSCTYMRFVDAVKRYDRSCPLLMLLLAFMLLVVLCPPILNDLLPCTSCLGCLEGTERSNTVG